MRDKPTMKPAGLTTHEKALRVEEALRILRDELRGRTRAGGQSPAKLGQNLHLANTLNGVVQNEGEELKARLFDLITTYETKDEALQSLEDAGFTEGRPG